MIPERKKPGKESKHFKPILECLSGKKRYLPFNNRRDADNCATYFKGHFHGRAGVRKEDDEFRVYVEVSA